MRKAVFCTILLTLGIFLLGARPGAAAPSYTCFDLTMSPGAAVSSAYGLSLNEVCEVVGTGIPVETARPLSPGIGPVQNTGIVVSGWRGRLRIIIIPTIRNGAGMWINGSARRKRWWAGTWNDKDPPYSPHAFLYNGDTDTAIWDLGTLGGAGSWANSVNDLGQVVGGSNTSSGAAHAFLYSGGAMQDLNTLAKNLPAGVILYEGRGINNAGQVVGGTSGAKATAFLYDGAYHDLGTLEAPFNERSEAYAINARGQVVGYSSSALGDDHAFLYTDGKMQDLGALPGGLVCRALGVNDAGQVVGYSSSAVDTRAFVYSEGIIYDLNPLVQDLPPGVVLTAAHGINNAGQIIADGNRGHGFVLTPVSALPGVNLLLLD